MNPSGPLKEPKVTARPATPISSDVIQRTPAEGPCSHTRPHSPSAHSSGAQFNSTLVPSTHAHARSQRLRFHRQACPSPHTVKLTSRYAPTTSALLLRDMYRQ